MKDSPQILQSDAQSQATVLSDSGPGQGTRLRDLFEDLIDVMDIALWELDLNYQVIALNRKAKRIYGMDAIGKPCYYVAARRNTVCPGCPAKRVYEGEPSGRSEHRRKTVSGQTIYIDHIATPIRDSQGRLSGALVVIIDITRHKLMEQELKNSRAHLEAIVAERTRELAESRARLAEAQAIAHLGSWELGLSTDKAVWSDELFRILGYAPQSFAPTGQRFFDAILPEDRSRVREAMEGSRTGNQPYQLDFRIQRPDQAIRYVEARGKPLPGPSHYSDRMVGTVLDITQRRLAEQGLKQSEKRFRELFNNANDAIYLYRLNPDQSPGRILEANRIACERLGYSRQEYMNMRATDIADPEKIPQLATIIAQLVSGDGHLTFEWTHLAKDGTRVPVEISAHLFESEGQQQVLSIARDLTERRNAEKEKKRLEAQIQQAQKMEALGVLAGGIAHDFNNILFPIIGFTEMLLDDLPPDSQMRRSAENILTASKRAKDLVRQILTFSRQADQEIKPFQLQLVLKEILKLTSSFLPSYIRINRSIDPACPMVMADPTQLHQLVMNLITNAFHAMEGGPGELTVALSEVYVGSHDLPGSGLSPGPYACLTVQDTGTGMDPATLKRIYDPYFTTKASDKGTGLGLAVVHGIVESHGGAIRVRSKPGQGTTFKVYFPCHVQTCGDPIVAGAPLPFGKERILLVDDEIPVLEIEAEILRRLGYSITALPQSRQALDAVAEHPHAHDLVITDISLPEMTGDRLVAEIRKIRPDLPVIVCTGFSDNLAEQKAKKLGIQGILMKPVARAELARMVREVLDQGDRHPD